MVSVSEEAISRAIYKNWNTIYSDEHIGVDWTGRGQGFSVRDLIDGEFQIDFQFRKEWWIPGEHVEDVKNIIKQKLTEAGITPTKLKIYGKAYPVSWMHNKKYVGVYRIKFVEKIIE